MGYDMYYRDGTGRDGEGYFRLNIWGMRWALACMDEAGMVFEAGPHPAWPDNWDDDEAVEAILTWHGPEIPGIPAHKFCSNDGWVVLPAECEAAAKLADGYEPGARDGMDAAESAELWRRWVDYIGRSAKHGGFEVH